MLCARREGGLLRVLRRCPVDLRLPGRRVTRIGINGFGRIGRLALRAGWDRGDLQFVHVNEPNGGPDAAAHLLTFDSVHGRWERGARGDGATLTIDGVELVFSEAMAPGRGRLDGGRRRGGARVLRQVPNRRGVGGAYFERGVQKVIAAPVRGAHAPQASPCLIRCGPAREPNRPSKRSERLPCHISGSSRQSSYHHEPARGTSRGTGRIVPCVHGVRSRGRMGRRGRDGTDRAVLLRGWGPGGRRFKSCLPDSQRVRIGGVFVGRVSPNLAAKASRRHLSPC